MSQAVLAYLQRQRRDLVEAFAGFADAFVGVREPGQTGRTPRGSTWGWDATVDRERAFVCTVAGRAAEYWVHVDLEDYRTPFRRFLEREFGLPATQVTGEWHADHLLNRAFARAHGIAFVRMALVPAEYNTSHGRTVEKGVTRMPANDKSMYHLDYFIMMKVLGVAPPATLQDYRARRGAIAREFVASGAVPSAELALVGLDGMFESLWPVLRDAAARPR